MKRMRAAFVILVIFSLVFMTGCATNKSVSDEKVSINTSIIHGSTSGTWFMLATGIAESLGKSYPGSLMQVTPGDIVGNIFRMNNYETEFGITQTNKAFEAITGTGAFEEKLENIAGVAVFYPSVAQLAVKEELGITSFDDFIERKVPINISIGSLKGTSTASFKQVIGEYGLTLEDLEAWGCKFYHKGISETGEMFSDGAVDGIWIIAGTPMPAIVQMGTNSEMMIVPMSHNIVDSVVEKFGYNNFTLKGNSYSFEENDIYSFSTYTMLGASLDVSDDTAYKVAKSIYENIAYINTIHSALKDLTAENLINGMSIPLHPGAEKFYKEIGLID